MKTYSIGIVGAGGYGGGEALRILCRHPNLRVSRVYGDSTAGTPIGDRFPALHALAPQVAGLVVEPFEPENVDCDVLIASLPTGASRGPLSRVPAGVKIVDIGGDHRFVDGWTYGMADLRPDRIRESTKIANPGCYPSAAVLALAPLVEAGLVEDGPVIVDAKSGVSGAGRGGGGSDGFGFSETNESLHAYKALTHVHEGEIRSALAEVGSRFDRLAFVPHLVPMTRGLLATCYVTSSATADQCADAARSRYEGRPFVRVVETSPRTKSVAGSNLCFVHYAADPARRLVVATSAIDNLGKGAAGQAVQNVNLMLGLDEAAGLEGLPVWP